jgi:hypothetical protein
MIRRLQSALLPFALVAGAAACGGGGGGSLSAGEAFDQSIEDSCAQAHACRDSFPADQGFEFEDIYQDSVDACVTFLGGLFGYDGGDVQAAADAGTLEYNADDASECLAYFDGLSCEEFWTPTEEPPAACDDAFVGTVANGDACEIDLECEAGSCEDLVCVGG